MTVGVVLIFISNRTRKIDVKTESDVCARGRIVNVPISGTRWNVECDSRMEGAAGQIVNTSVEVAAQRVIARKQQSERGYRAEGWHRGCFELME